MLKVLSPHILLHNNNTTILFIELLSARFKIVVAQKKQKKKHAYHKIQIRVDIRSQMRVQSFGGKMVQGQLA